MEDRQEAPNSPQPNRERNPFDSDEGLKDYIRKERQTVDYSQMVTPTTRVLALGETHTREITKQEVIDSLEQFKNLGFTHIGMEVFGIDAQPELDEYQKTGDKKEELKKRLREGFGSRSPNAGELYLHVVDEAKRVGLQVVGIDLPKSEQDQYEIGSMDKQNSRNEKMAQTVQGILDKNPKHKVVTLTGNDHAGKWDSQMANLLSIRGVGTITVKIVGGSRIDRRAFEEYAAVVGAAKERFMIACLARFPGLRIPYDWMIHLPQLETETEFERVSKELLERFEAVREKGKRVR